MGMLVKQCSFAIFLFLMASYQSQAAEESLRITLEKAYKKHLAAYESGKASVLQETMSSFLYGTMKNNLTNAKRHLTPELIKSMAEDIPDISKMRFVKILENGPTAGLLYVQESEERDASNKPRITFAFIKFVNENSAWKVDGVFDTSSPKYQNDGTETMFNMHDLPPSLIIDGKVFKTPEATPVPYAAGFLDIFSSSYKTSVIINGIEQYVDAAGGPSMLIKGGLRKGGNNIRVVFIRNGKESSFGPSVTIRRIYGEREIREVFKYEPKNTIEGEHVLTFTIDE